MKKNKRVIALIMVVLLFCSTFMADINVMAEEYDAKTETQISEENSKNVETQANEDSDTKNDSLKKEDTEVSTGDETVTDSDTQTKVTEEENQDNLQTEQEDQKKENKLNYLYINEAEQEVGAEQDILVSWGTEDENVDQLILEFENESGEQIDVFPSNKIDNAYLFQKIFDQGIYHVKGIRVISQDSDVTYTSEELDVNAYFGVGETYTGNDKSNYMEMESVAQSENEVATQSMETADVSASVVVLDENGDSTNADSIADAMEEVGVEKQTQSNSRARSVARKSDVVVVLDPGHDAGHTGAYGNGVREEVATLKIAQACKEELEQYSGVTVYMTRETAACPYPETVGVDSGNILDIKKRTAWAKTKDADVFISFHLNSSDATGANGAEVYYPAKSSEGKALAQDILNKLLALGLYNRKVKGNETYAVVNSSMANGFPGLIIEHAFVSNSSDASNYLNSDAKLKKLGVADAAGIVEYFGLSKGYWETGKNGEKYYYAAGEKVTGEKNISGKWYYFDPDKDGAMVTGFHKFANKTVYYGTDGAMCYGEQRINGKWYYFDKVTGGMITGIYQLENKTVYYGTDGTMQYGEQRINNKWYYFDKVTGGMITGIYQLENKTVYYGTDGTMQYGEQRINNKWYYFAPDKDGAMVTGFYKFSNKTVYYGSDGAMCYGEQIIEGKTYYFNSVTGALQEKDGWHIDNKNKYYYLNGERVIGEKYISGKWYYFDPDKEGAMVTGFYKFSNKTVYYGTDGAMCYGEQIIEGKIYYFDKVTGALKEKDGWRIDGENTYYYSNGERIVGEKYISGKWYYFNPNKEGAMTTGFHSFTNKTVYYGSDGAMCYGEQIIGGKTYHFDKITGALQEKKEGWYTEEEEKFYYENGKQVTGEKYISGKWYYFNPDKKGAMVTGIHKFSNKTVYYGNDGTMQYGEQRIDGKWYYFDNVTGAMITGFHQFSNKTVYYGSDGIMQYGEQRINGKWYYFDDVTGAMITGFKKFLNKTVYYGTDGTMQYGQQSIDGKWYYFDDVTGAMITGFKKLSNKTVYYGTDGTMQYGEQRIAGKDYAFDVITGAMIVDGIFNGNYYGATGEIQECYLIEGTSQTTVEQMVRYFNKYKGKREYPSAVLEKGGAADIETFAKIFYEEAIRENIKPEVVWAQTMIETGFLQFGGQVKIEQFNFAGLGATDGGAAGAKFENVRMGVRAQVQHLKAYANAEITLDTLKSECVDPRFKLVDPKGCAKYVEWLGQKENPEGKGWATSAGYGIRLRKIIDKILES